MFLFTKKWNKSDQQNDLSVVLISSSTFFFFFLGKVYIKFRQSHLHISHNYNSCLKDNCCIYHREMRTPKQVLTFAQITVNLTSW